MKFFRPLWCLWMLPHLTTLWTSDWTTGLFQSSTATQILDWIVQGVCIDRLAVLFMYDLLEFSNLL
jgi:hypothetical protein